MISIDFDPNKFENEINECSICLEEFQNINKKVTPLPCNSKHLYHTECIVLWMKT